MKINLHALRATLHASLCLVFILTTSAFGEISMDIVTVTALEPEKRVEGEATFAEDLTAPENVTFDFKDADIHNVLKIISFKSGVNIITTPDVIGTVTIRLVDVPWDLALEAILKSNGYGYQRSRNIILVGRLDTITRIQLEEPVKTEIIELKFLDAFDAQKVLLPLLTRRGQLSVLYKRGIKGWTFGTYTIGKEKQQAGALTRIGEDITKEETISLGYDEKGNVAAKAAKGLKEEQRSRTLIITDTASSLERIITQVLPKIDIRPQQVLIEARIMEVNKNKLRDLGVDWGLGTAGAEPGADPSLLANQVVVAKNSAGVAGARAGGNMLGSTVAPSLFSPLEAIGGATGPSAVFPYNMGAQLVFQKLTGWKFEAIVHALEEDADTNVLSAPRILTLDSQEASIMVGYHTPIFSTNVSSSSTAGGAAASTITQTLDYYQEIGIKLFVVPQINKDGCINMIIHPSITSSSSNVNAQITATGIPAPVITPYPVIDVRETQTQILIKDGETVVIGGLLKDQDGKETQGIPFLENIPLLGGLFRRDTYIKKKSDLLIFITARLVKEGEFTFEELARLQENLGKEQKEIAAADRKKKKKVSVKIDNATPLKK